MSETAVVEEIFVATAEPTGQLRVLVEGMRAHFDGPGEGVCRRLAEAFSLSEFELGIVLLGAAAELDAATAGICAALGGGIDWPTFQLAMAHLGDGHWSAILPQGALRRWRLVEVGDSDVLMTARLTIAEPVMHFLMGAACLDERLDGVLATVEPPRALPESYRGAAEEVARMLLEDGVPQLCGSASLARRTLAAAACAAVGLRLYEISLSPVQEAAMALIERDAALVGFVVLVEVDEGSRARAAQFVDGFAGKAILLGNCTVELRRSTALRVTVDRPGAADQRSLWNFALGEDIAAFGDEVERVSTQFSLDSERILRAGAALRQRVRSGGDAGAMLVEFCRTDARSALGALAQRIEAKAGWGDIVLPESSLEVLKAIAAQVRQQGRVLDGWGFARQTARGLGISALFHGLSGTGKTLAAEVLAKELNVDLFRIDLSQMVSKYIGETEKNLSRLFDAAENTGAILLFDEADALFGKRSEVRDSHDRYANMEVSYLLQRVESYRGLAILTTNLKGAMDNAFLRRISFFVSFPFPDQMQRKSIWQRVFPAEMPSEGLDFDKLARLNLPGGNIRSIALNAAYIAADREEPVRMEHLLIASRRECAKIERPLSASESGGWV